MIDGPANIVDRRAIGPRKAIHVDGIEVLALDQASAEHDPLALALEGFGLRPDHVLSHRVKEDGSVVVITKGGQKVEWPRDRAHVLSPMEKGEPVTEPVPGAGIFSCRVCGAPLPRTGDACSACGAPRKGTP